MGNACDCASLAFSGIGSGADDERGLGGGGGDVFGSGVGSGMHMSAGGANAAAALATSRLEAIRAFESYSDEATRENTANQDRKIRGDQRREGFDSDKSDLDGNSADDFCDAGNQTQGESTNSDYSRKPSLLSRSGSKENVTAKLESTLLTGAEEEKMWEDLRQDLQVLDDQLTQETEAFDENLPLDTLTTHLRGFVRGDDGLPVLAATKSHAPETFQDAMLDTGHNKETGSLRDVIAATDDVLAGLEEFEDDNW